MQPTSFGWLSVPPLVPVWTVRSRDRIGFGDQLAADANPDEAWAFAASSSRVR